MCSLASLSAIQVLTVFVFWGQIQNYMMRTNLSILIVAMVKEPRNKSSEFNNLTCSDNLIQTKTTSSNVTEEESNEILCVVCEKTFTITTILRHISHPKNKMKCSQK